MKYATDAEMVAEFRRLVKSGGRVGFSDVLWLCDLADRRKDLIVQTLAEYERSGELIDGTLAAMTDVAEDTSVLYPDPTVGRGAGPEREPDA